MPQAGNKGWYHKLEDQYRKPIEQFDHLPVDDQA
jgi:hypothetical protein